jgi:D-arabinose 1-dehydrogenase-like Zn-dependent alcohol dehydrogenase
MVLVGASLDDVPIKAITAGYFFSLQGHRVIGSTHNGPAYLREALEFASSRNIQPRVEVFAKERVGEAYERVAAGQVRFRAVVTY